VVLSMLESRRNYFQQQGMADSYRQGISALRSDYMKSFGHILALVTMMALVINAQCLVSCSIQAVPGPVSAPSSQVLVHEKGHACCPHPGPSNTHGKSDSPCRHPLTQSDAARLEAPSTVNLIAVPVSLVAQPGSGSLPILSLGRFDIYQVRVQSRPPLLSPLAVLRV
jgi:hypothetical protein